jgi:saccharopine dehydrogenase-like NADP-dependent oxidoreductase
MRGRLLISDNTADIDTMRSLYEPAPGNENEEEVSEAILKKLAVNHGTKVIIVNNNNKEKLQLIKNSLNELKTWHYNATRDFVYYKFLNDKTWLIVLNNINGTTEEKLKSLIIKQTD